MSSLLLTGAGSLTSAGIAPVAPVVVSASVAADGVTLTLTFDKAVNLHTGFALRRVTPTSGLFAKNYTSGDGTTAKVFTVILTTVKFGDVVVLDYTPGDVVDLTGNPLQMFTDFPVTNLVLAGDPAFRSFVGLAFGGARSAN